VALNVLVVSDGSPTVEAIASRLAAEMGTHGFFDGIVLPSAAPAQLSAAELQLLHDYEATFKVREIAGYNWANPTLGLNYPAYSGGLDGMTATVTASGLAGPFSYLNGPVPLDDLSSTVTESYGYLATPLDSTFTPLLTAPVPGTSDAGSLIGVYSTGGREQLVMTFGFNANQQHAKVLTHGLISWLTRGISLGYSRNYFSAHIDDVLLPDGVWNAAGNCTVGSDCDPAVYPPTAPDAAVRMSPADVTRLNAWQDANGIKLDMTFNGNGATEQKDATGSDALETALLASKSKLRWINHTWSHEYLGCVQNYTVTPWACVTTSTGATSWVPASTITSQINLNKNYATAKALPNFSAAALVTGEHSGLKTLPQMPTDNPALASVLNNTGIKWIAADASREHDTRAIGGATTVPRYPMNIYYNTSTIAEAVDEYNWIYTSVADGGSGKCEQYTDVMTCQTPLDAAGFATIADRESRTALGHVLANDPRPHFAHQSNLADDGVLYPVLDELLSTYKSLYAANTPIVNPTMADAGGVLLAQSRWAQKPAGLVATVSGSKVTVENRTIRSIAFPMTLPTGARRYKNSYTLVPFGTAYAGQVSDQTSVMGLMREGYQLAAPSGFATTAVWPVPAVPAASPAAAPTAAPTAAPAARAGSAQPAAKPASSQPAATQKSAPEAGGVPQPTDVTKQLNPASTVVIESDLDVHALDTWLHALEDAHGRRRDVPRFSSRPLDIDVVFFDDLVLDGPGHLQLPRPELQHAFVLRPLADIAPDFVHPLSGLTLGRLWQQHPDCDDPLVP